MTHNGGINQQSRIWKLGINSFETIWTLPVLNIILYVETNSDCYNMLQRNGIWWLGGVEFLPESFKHLICSRIRVSTVAWSNGSPWHAKPPPRRSGKLPSAGNEKPNGGYTPGFEEISFPFLSIATLKNKNVVHIYIYINIYISRNKNISDGTPYMQRNQMRRFHATYGNPSRWKAIVQDMAEMANAAQNKWTSFPLKVAIHNLPIFRASSKHVAGSISSGVCLWQSPWAFSEVPYLVLN